MAKVWGALLAGLALLALGATAYGAAPAARQVPTETIIVPPDGDNDALGPGIPSSAGEQPEATPPDATDPAATEPDLAAPDATPAPAEADEPLPTIEYDVDKLPAPVKRLREQIIAAAITGEFDKLKPIVEANGEPPQFGFTEADDPLTYLKAQSGDPEGREILAILQEVLQAGYVHVDVGTTEEMYIWPYFARYPLDKLTAPQMVELFKIITAGDYDDMKPLGTYLFYRAGISPNGEWKYFIAGD
ncbi:MAG: hypothetical protein ABI399_01870 [Bauldia sp.]